MASAASYSTLVQQLYVAYFGRPADYFGLQNFEAALAAANAPTDPAALAAAYSTNAAVKTLVDSFGTSHESTALYGSGSTESFVNAIFENLFNRPAAVAGLTFWVNAINSGAVSKGDAALAILAGAENNSTTQGKADWTLIGNKIGVASNFTTALGSSSNQIVAYAGATAAQDARLMLSSVTGSTVPATFNVQTTINNIVAGNNQNTYNLTTGVDTFTGGTGNNVFNAILDNATGLTAGGQAATLQSFDSITGGTLNNTLNITDFGVGSTMTIPTGAAISGITTLNVNSLEAPSLNVSGWSTLAAVNINSSTGNDVLTVGNNVAVAVTNTGTITVTGGSTLNLTEKAAGAVNVVAGVGATSVSVTGGSGGYAKDANYVAGTGTHTLSSVSLTGVGGNFDVYSDALTSLTINTQSGNTDTVHAAVGTRTLGLTLNGDSGVTVADANATTLAVTTTGAASTSITLQDGAATSVTFTDAQDLSLTALTAGSAKAVTISGAGAFTAAGTALTGLAAGAAIDASGSTGVVTISMASASSKGDVTQSFTGGTGQDIVTVGAGQTGTVTGGSATNNEIILDNAPGATQAALAAYSHFSILGVAGSTSGTFDMSKLTNGSSYTSFDVQQSSGNVTFTNVATGSTISLEGGNSNVVTLQTADKTGATDSTTVTLGTTSTIGNSYTQVTLEDSIFVGTGTVNLVSNVKAAASANTLTSLYDNNWVTLNVSGTGGLNIGTSKVSSSSLTINNTEVAHGPEALVITNLNAANLTSLTFNGSEGALISNLNSAATSLTLVDNNTSTFEIGALGDTALTSATFTNSVNSSSAAFVIDGTPTEAGLATLNLNGNVAFSVTGVAVTSGITVAGGTDNATVTFDSSASGATVSGKTDSITLGNGDHDIVHLGAGVAGSTQTVVLGNGVGDTISSTSLGTVNATVGSATAGTDSITANSASTFHVTAGNGTNVISDTAASAATSITVGTGANSITVGNTASGTIALGTHAATVADSITLGYSNSVTTSVAGMEKISGLNNVGADTLVFSGDAAPITAITEITAAQVSALHGDTTLLSDWIATAAGKGGAVTANTVAWFSYQGNTYLVNLTAADAGHLSANDTVVELTGTYTFAHTTFTGGNGHVNLLG